MQYERLKYFYNIVRTGINKKEYRNYYKVLILF